MLIEQFFDPGLGHASYLVADPDAGVAFLVDPDRQIDAYLAAASRLGVLITDSFETHVHNDYVAGSRALAELRPIVVHSGALAEMAYPHEGHADGDVIRVGELAVRCVATPGHTPEHVAYLVSDLRRADDPQYLFSGGALLVGHIARVDLLGPDVEETLARSAYETLRERVLPLADYVAVFPTHGGGSACTAEVAGSRWTTLGFERRHNHVARAASGDYASFRTTIAEGLPVAPAYYPHVRAMNARGAQLSSRSPLPFLRDAPRGAVLIDPRPPHLFGAAHRREALNVVGNDSFAVRVGAIVPFAAPVVVLTVDPEQAERLRAQLSLIGFDDVRGYMSPEAAAGDEPLRIEQLDARAAASRASDGAVLLDVREESEWRAGHAPGAIHIPYEQVRDRAGEIPAGRPIVTYCAGGIRSSLAASVLESAGRDVANIRGGFTAWRGAGLPISRET
ncbi:MAG TPA: MBL fold metallo-hydrolase [Candidatus Limnocylindria bacterium]|nr:MBL fold metallo-hydrolase [Candidatus Limnocylindria bacterium]